MTAFLDEALAPRTPRIGDRPEPNVAEDRRLAYPFDGKVPAMLAVNLDPDTERRLADLAKNRGQSRAEVARDLIESCLEDLADIEMAVARLQDRRPALSSGAARTELGLDD